MRQATTQRAMSRPVTLEPPGRRRRTLARILIGLAALLLVAAGSNAALQFRD
jgi:hypothetical protein